MVTGMNYKELHESGNTPRVHGNGFIQLDLADGKRLHVWDKNIPRQEVDTSIHDHAFGFHSKVICGTLINITYDIESNDKGIYAVYTPIRVEGTEDTKLAPTGERVHLVTRESGKYPTGSEYYFKPLMFHETGHIGTTATIIEKTERLDVEPRVLVPWGDQPDNSFDREAFNPEHLWMFIEKALELANEIQR